MPEDCLYLTFDNMSKPVALINCRHLLECFPFIFPGWQIAEALAENPSPVLSLTREENSEDGAICLLVAELMRAYVHEDRQLLCLHGAAAEFAGKLVLFPNKYRAGKSVLSASLACAGVQLFCDDVLPISLRTGEGIAPGLAPRLRLPLPDNLSPPTRDYISKHNRLQGEQYLYLDLENDALAPRGRQLPIGAFVLLEREEGASPVLENVSEADILHQVIWQNFAREAEAPDILAVLSRLVAGSERLLLRYDRAEDAVRLLCEEFRDWSAQPETTNQDNVVAGRSTSVAHNLSPGFYLRKPDISIVQIEGQAFLADAQGATIHHLNPIDHGADSIDNDLRGLIDELSSRNLLLTEASR
jgi:hypothetical protein